jgi:hypothetical protein
MNANAEKNQEVLEKLSELEEFFFYKKNNPEELAPFFLRLAEMHTSVKTLLCQWATLTGLKIQ